MGGLSRRQSLAVGAALGAFALAGAAYGQSSPVRPDQAEVADPALDQDDDAAQLDEIVVTGTLLRGVAPTGTNVVGLNSEALIATGAASANDVLAKVPQISNSFNSAPQPGGVIANPTNRPNIRNLGSSGGSTTLLLLNGNRMVGAGVLQTSPDPSVIPPGILERVEVIPDGGSSIYGSDAIGGVINFITKKRADGLELTARYGVADAYSQFDANLTAGRSWSNGSGLISYAYAQHDNIFGADRDYYTQNHTAQGGSDFRPTNCEPGNITVGSVTYALPSRTVGINRCDESKVMDFYPSEERHSVFGSLTQNLGDALVFDLTAYYSTRDTSRLGQGPSAGTGLRGSGTITSANPYFRPIGAETSQTVAFSFENAVPGGALSNETNFTSLGVTPSLTYSFENGWRLKAQANFGRSTNEVHSRQIDTIAQAAALAGTTTATALNPYNVTATNPAVLAAIVNYETGGESDQEIREVRAVVDGALLTLPAGDLKLAVGAEYHEETLDQAQGSGPLGAPVYFRSSSKREVASAFAEVLAPVFGEESGFGAFDLSASVRYDDYSDVGGTTNPKIGFNYKPVPALRLRGNWGTSFHAPSLADTGNSVDTRVQVLAVSPFRPSSSAFSDLFRPTILLAGGNPNLKPETADTWSIGGDWTPSGALQGLKVNLTYYNVAFTDAIGLAPFFQGATYFANPSYTSYYTLNPTLAQATAATAGQRVENAPSVASLYAGGPAPFVLIDARRNNLGSLDIDGLDFNVSYDWDVSFGSLHAGIAGTYTLNRESQAVSGATKLNDLDNGFGRYQLVGSFGADLGDFGLEATVNHSAGYDVIGVAGQTAVDSFTLVNLFARYDLPTGGWLSDTTLTANIDNLFDEEPPYYNIADGYANGSTLGRLVSIGIRKKF